VAAHLFGRYARLTDEAVVPSLPLAGRAREGVS
jgi:hypothetical protein